MLKSLKTTNFRKMENNHIEFESGMVVVRGSNEAGKTTMLEAIAYALFGVKSCRGSLAEVVTWGKADTTLSVELVVACDGTDYTITRSKSGAEINYESGKVTGQNECSLFVERLFGVSNGNVSKLIYGSQGDIRGALSQGPKATTELIENLANFDLIDTVVDLVQTNLITGPTAALEAVLQSADLRLELVKAQVIEPDTDGWEETAQGFDKSAADFYVKAEALLPDVLEVKTTLDEATKQAVSANNLNAKIALFKESTVSRQASIVALEVAAKNRPDTVAVTKAEKDLAHAKNSAALQVEFLQMQRVMDTYPEDLWEGSEDSLDAEVTKTQGLLSDFRDGITAQRANKILFESQKVTGSVCGFCSQDVSKFPEIAKKNADLDASLIVADEMIANLKAMRVDEQATLDVLLGIRAAQAKYKALVSLNVEAGTLQVPYSLSWVGPDVTNLDPQWEGEAATKLATLKIQLEKANAADAKIEAEKDLVAEYAVKITAADAELTQLPLAEQLEDLRAKYSLLFETHAGLVNEVAEAKFQAEGIRGSIANEASAYADMLSAVTDAEQDVEIAKKRVADLSFNNALIKRLRSARPIIADRLWSVVLGAVSSYFSTMRGVVSVVTKASDGFKVDGQSVEGLSGSTLDILGLAIRLALTRTFLPSAPFLILDEPSAAMDDKRSQEMVGFLLAFGFAQTLMVTHKEVNEGAANQLITL